MSNIPQVGSGSVLWKGRPWIAPAALGRTIVVIVVALVIAWLEFFTGTANDYIGGLPTILWTIIVFLVIWFVSISDLLIQRAANSYLLRNDSLEIKQGILTLKSYMIVASGFTDVEVIQGVMGRILNYGDIIVRLQGDRARRMIKVRNPVNVGDQIRSVMARPIVRIENPVPTTQFKGD